MLPMKGQDVIINIRGTSGSGKTTVAKSLLPDGERKLVILAETSMASPTKANPERRRPMRITGTTVEGGDTVLLGSYENNCGGCDGFSWKGAHDWIERGIINASQQYNNVVYEGLIISGSYKRYRDLALKTPGVNHHWMLLVTPFEECLQRVHLRTGAPIDERKRSNSWSKWKPVSELAAYMSQDPDVPRNLTWSQHEDTEEAIEFAKSLVGR